MKNSDKTKIVLEVNGVRHRLMRKLITWDREDTDTFDKETDKLCEVCPLNQNDCHFICSLLFNDNKYVYYFHTENENNIKTIKKRNRNLASH